jgi:CheY-like chemotaxis protein
LSLRLAQAGYRRNAFSRALDPFNVLANANTGLTSLTLARTRRNNMNVLFVDDHVACADMFADIAEGLGHRACVAHNSVSALQRCSEETFDLILMDISLPDGDGRDVCCELRTSGRAQKTRIVALTGHGDLKGSSCMSDFDGCIVKPIAMEALEALLKDNESSPV